MHIYVFYCDSKLNLTAYIAARENSPIQLENTSNLLSAYSDQVCQIRLRQLRAGAEWKPKFSVTAGIMVVLAVYSELLYGHSLFYWELTRKTRRNCLINATLAPSGWDNK
jgi:hypothetical protein